MAINENTEVVILDEQDHKMKPNGMRGLAREVEQYHTTPFPRAHPLDVNPFPARVMSGLWLGLGVGAIIGLITGMLMRNNVISVPGWEGLYSMVPFTFNAFWTLAGAALGMLIAGVAFILAAPAPESPVKVRPEK